MGHEAHRIVDSGPQHENQKFAFVFANLGTYEYDCGPHQGTIGTVIDYWRIRP